MDFEIIRSARKTISIEIVSAEKVVIKAPFQATDEDVKDAVLRRRRWIETHLSQAKAREQAMASVRQLSVDEIQALANKALTVIPERVKYYAPLVGVTYGNITIRNQKSRWGSCSSKGNLNFNCLLMLAPPEVIDSVVVHELCHRKEMNHSKKFYAEVFSVFPNYWECDKWLKENGKRLLAMMLG